MPIDNGRVSPYLNVLRHLLFLFLGGIVSGTNRYTFLAVLKIPALLQFSMRELWRLQSQRSVFSSSPQRSEQEEAEPRSSS